ncbi:unnamed protein product, partial [Pylaiella littoralis]
WRPSRSRRGEVGVGQAQAEEGAGGGQHGGETPAEARSQKRGLPLPARSASAQGFPPDSSMRPDPHPAAWCIHRLRLPPVRSHFRLRCVVLVISSDGLTTCLQR